jgi:hypothetical protein
MCWPLDLQFVMKKKKKEAGAGRMACTRRLYSYG